MVFNNMGRIRALVSRHIIPSTSVCTRYIIANYTRIVKITLKFFGFFIMLG